MINLKKLKDDIIEKINFYLNDPHAFAKEGYFGVTDICEECGVLCRCLIIITDENVFDGKFGMTGMHMRRLRVIDRTYSFNKDNKVPFTEIEKIIEDKWNEIERFAIFFDNDEIREAKERKNICLWYDNRFEHVPSMEKIEDMIVCLDMERKIQWNRISLENYKPLEVIKCFNGISDEMWNLGLTFAQFLGKNASFDRFIDFDLDNKYHFYNDLSIYKNKKGNIILRLLGGYNNLDLTNESLKNFLINAGLKSHDGIEVKDPSEFMDMLELLKE